MSETLETLGIRLQSVQDDTEGLREKITAIDVAIRGNGEPGLKRGMVQIDNRLQRLEDWRESVRRLTTVSIVAVIGLFVNLLWQIITTWKVVIGS